MVTYFQGVAGGLGFCVDVVVFSGHENVRALHRSTLEVTKDSYLTPRGDCIIGVASSKSALEISQCVKEVLRGGGLLVVVVATASGLYDYLYAEGSGRLTFRDSRRIVIRRSSYVDDSTIGIRSSKAAGDLDRSLVEALRRGERGFLVLVAIRRPPELSTHPKHL
ncbi:MAG: DUF371 domain-containing protein [Sulfolobales archaeon]|nr:DUF371 domain-containing protein [Sulfolobales archaeon]MDW8082589.1 DUF371 domain-containing protein [Sulfolobales archaeon]